MESASAKRDLPQMVRDGLSAMVFAFGYKIGIVNAFSELQQPCTAEELSLKAGKKLRYIQEWLGCMVAANIVTISEDAKYSLPYENMLLKNVGSISTVIPVFCEMFPKLEEVTLQDGPSGYEPYKPFLHWLDNYRTAEALKSWNETVLAPVMNLKSGENFTILDLGCGFGKISREIGKLYPKSTVFAIDIDEYSIEQAKKETFENGPNNIEFHCTRGGNLPKDWSEKFDFVLIIDVLHDSFEVDDILKEVGRVLKPDGYAAAFDPPVSSYHNKVIKDGTAQMFLPFSLFYCLPVSSMGPTGEGLGVGWGYERRKKKIEECGFRVVPVGDKDVETIQEIIVFQKVVG